jgi:hypothetical protein
MKGKTKGGTDRQKGNKNDYVDWGPVKGEKQRDQWKVDSVMYD